MGIFNCYFFDVSGEVVFFEGEEEVVVLIMLLDWFFGFGYLYVSDELWYGSVVEIC